MYKDSFENIEIYFICDNDSMELVETDYDEETDTHYWYFNAKLCYQKWKENFKNSELQELTKKLFTIAASRYIIYVLENSLFKKSKQYLEFSKDLKKIEPEINKIIAENDLLKDL